MIQKLCLFLFHSFNSYLKFSGGSLPSWFSILVLELCNISWPRKQRNTWILCMSHLFFLFKKSTVHHQHSLKPIQVKSCILIASGFLLLVCWLVIRIFSALILVNQFFTFIFSEKAVSQYGSLLFFENVENCHGPNCQILCLVLFS